MKRLFSLVFFLGLFSLGAKAQDKKPWVYFDLGDTVDAALKTNMMVKDYEKALVAANPQLDITFKIESK